MVIATGTYRSAGGGAAREIRMAPLFEPWTLGGQWLGCRRL